MTVLLHVSHKCFFLIDLYEFAELISQKDFRNPMKLCKCSSTSAESHFSVIAFTVPFCAKNRKKTKKHLQTHIYLLKTNKQQNPIQYF